MIRLAVLASPSFTPSDWTYQNYYDKSSYLVPLPPKSPTYKRLADILKTVPTAALHATDVARKIERIQNPFLYAQFLLKKEEYKSRNINCNVIELFHDTNVKHVPSIVQDNFDWRKSRRGRFGFGVTFSPVAKYANKVGSCYNGKDRAMIVADVLVGRTEPGLTRQVLPKVGDTTLRNGRKVAVKYHDDEFYPKYVIYYKNK